MSRIRLKSLAPAALFATVLFFMFSALYAKSPNSFQGAKHYLMHYGRDTIQVFLDSLQRDSLYRDSLFKDSIAKEEFRALVRERSKLYPEHVLRPVKGKVKGAYDFWVYTPKGYDSTFNNTPVIVFLHGRSLCGRNLDMVRRYGTLDAVERGREIPALVIAPQNPGEAWNPKKLCLILDWLKENYPHDTTRVYALGMSLGGYGTMDFVGSCPDRVAAGIALCGGTTLKDVSPMGEVPLWIIHGTADRDVPVKYSQVVVKELEKKHLDKRLRYDWLIGTNHSYLARYFYHTEVYQWLFSHSLSDEGRPVNREIKIKKEDLKNVYSGWIKPKNVKIVYR